MKRHERYIPNSHKSTEIYERSEERIWRKTIFRQSRAGRKFQLHLRREIIRAIHRIESAVSRQEV